MLWPRSLLEVGSLGIHHRILVRTMKPSLIQPLLFLAATLIGARLETAQADPKAGEAVASSPTNAPVRMVGDGLFEIGSVQLDKTQRTVSFPAVVNLKDTAVEYLLVTQYGKIHESILRTETQPYHIHLAMLLLGVQDAGTNTFSENASVPPPGTPITVQIEWNTGSVTNVKPAGALIMNRKKNAPMASASWVFNGSVMLEGTFLAQQEGSIISLIGDPVALVNYPGSERADDENWLPNAKVLPEVETMVRVIFRAQPANKR